MSSSVPTEVEAGLQRLEASLTDLETHLQLLSTLPPLKEVSAQVIERTLCWVHLHKCLILVVVPTQLSPVECAQLHATLAYSLNSLYFGTVWTANENRVHLFIVKICHWAVYLKSLGTPTENHMVKKELERVKEYMKKIKQVEEEEKRTPAKWRRYNNASVACLISKCCWMLISYTERAAQPRVDRGAADRFIRHAINEHGDTKPADAAASGCTLIVESIPFLFTF